MDQADALLLKYKWRQRKRCKGREARESEEVECESEEVARETRISYD